jgi:hypothetical protein
MSALDDPHVTVQDLGNSDRFDRALAEFSAAYADQNERDHRKLVEAEAIEAGRIGAEEGV